jgi:hypothetical protein
MRCLIRETRFAVLSLTIFLAWPAIGTPQDQDTKSGRAPQRRMKRYLEKINDESEYPDPLMERPAIDRKTKNRQASYKGIHVGEPKVYDDRSLQLMLQAAEQRLQMLQAIDQTRTMANIGTIQGGSQVETGFSAQVSSLPTASVVTNAGSNNSLTTGLTQGLSTTGTANTGVTNVANATPSTTTTAGTGTSTANTNSSTSSNASGSTGSVQTTMPTINPTLPSAPATSGLSLPTNVSVSARDVLNEEMQLTYEIANLRLLLQGSLNDRFVTGNQRLKQHVTVGFPISIEPPDDARYNGAAAEIRITVTTWPNFKDKNKKNQFWRDIAPAVLELKKQLNLSKAPVRDVKGSHLVLTSFRDASEATELLGKKSGGARVTLLKLPNCRAYFGDNTGKVVVKFSETVCPDAPGLMAILPREQTYNIIDIRGTNISLSGAATTQVLTAGVTWSRQTKHFYVRQAQDTVAFEDQPRIPEDLASLNEVSTSFGWQFRPVLQEKHVRGGLRQLFAELSFPTISAEDGGDYYGTVTIEAQWRHYDQRNGAVGKPVTDSQFEKIEVARAKSDLNTWLDGNSEIPSITWLGAWQLHEFNLEPTAPRQITWEDAGNGLISVTAHDFYTPGTAVVLGSTILGPNTSNYFYDPEKIRFVVAAADALRSENMYLEEQGGRQTDLRVRLEDTEEPPQLEVTDAIAVPFNNSESMVTVCYTGGKEISGSSNRPLALVGGTVFGLSDHPFIQGVLDDCDTGQQTLSFRASTDLLRTAKLVKVKQLFQGPHTFDDAEIEIRNDFAAVKVTPVAKANNCTLFAIQGNSLLADTDQPVHVRIGAKDLTLFDKTKSDNCDFVPKSTNLGPAIKPLAPVHGAPGARSGVIATPEKSDKCSLDKAYVDTKLGLTALLVALPDCVLTSATQIQLYRGESDVRETVSVLLPVTADKPPAAQVDVLEVPAGTKSVRLKGSHLELVDLSSLYFTGFVGISLAPKFPGDASYIELTLPDGLKTTPGNYALNFSQLDKDKTPGGSLVRILKPKTQ